MATANKSVTGSATDPVNLATRIAELETELAALRAEQRAALVAAIVIVVGPGVVFSARELWQHRRASPALASTFVDAGIHNARQLGKRLRHLRGSGLDRVGRDHDGALWTCTT